MATPKKKAVVSKKVSDDEKINSARWSAFVTASQIPWDDLSESFKDFFEIVGNIESREEDINNAVDLARGAK